MTMNAKLLTAIRHGDARAAGLLLAAGADANARDADGRSALTYVATINMSNVRRQEILADLLAHKADANLANAKGITPLHDAAAQGQWDVIKALVEKGANINAQSATGQTPLHAATYVAMGSGRTETISFLLENGANSAFRDNAGMTALDIASKNPRGAIYAATVAGTLKSWDEARSADDRRADLDAASQREKREAAKQAEARLKEHARRLGSKFRLKP